MLFGGVMFTQQSNAQVNLPFLEGFEPTSTTTSMWSYPNPDSIVAIDALQSGYGIGTSALMYNFFVNLGYNSYNAQTPDINNPKRSGLKLSFDFAASVRHIGPIFLPQDYAQDFIYLEYSKDNGTTWLLLDTFRIGTNGILNTGGIVPNMPFIPTASQWTTISNLKLPRGTNKINFRGVRTDNLESNFAYLDNVNIDTCYTPVPLANTVQYDSTYTIVANLQVNGSSLTWYSDALGINSITDSTMLTDSTYYFVTQTINGCESEPFAILFADTTTNPIDTITNIRSVDVFKNVRLYPNPANESITVDADIAIDNINITDVSGKIVLDIDKKTKILNIATLKAGIYFITVTSNESVRTYRITKK